MARKASKRRRRVLFLIGGTLSADYADFAEGK
jgi:hypothetical protein